VNPFVATRERYRLTQEQWARSFGVARSTVSAWESALAQPPPAVLAAYRRLQEPILRGDLAAIESTRDRLLRLADEAEREAARLNRERAAAERPMDVVAVGAAALALAMLLAYLFDEGGRSHR
jgi:transcriptional regulator with XRE-family HTH domain